MLRIREAEGTQAMGELRQKIAELEVRVGRVDARSRCSSCFLESGIDQSGTNHGGQRPARQASRAARRGAYDDSRVASDGFRTLDKRLSDGTVK